MGKKNSKGSNGAARRNVGYGEARNIQSPARPIRQTSLAGYADWQQKGGGRTRTDAVQTKPPSPQVPRKAPRLEPYGSEWEPYGITRTEDVRETPRKEARSSRTANDPSRFGEYYSNRQMPRQMHIPIPPSENGRYPDHSNPYYDRPAAVVATGKKARDIQEKLKTARAPKNPYSAAQPGAAGGVGGKATYSYAQPTAQRPPAANASSKGAHGKKGEAPRQQSRWAVPENSPLYDAYGREKINGRNADPGGEFRSRSGRNGGDSVGKNAGRSNREKMAADAVRKRAQAAEKRRKAAEKARKRDKRKFYVKAFFIRLAAVFVICAAVVGAVYYNTFSPDKKKSGGVDYTVQLGEKHNFSADGANAYVNGVLYVDFTALSRILGISSVGSTDSMRFIILSENEAKDSGGTGREEYVIFSDGMRGAFVNGTGVIMEGACRTVGLDIYVPLSFVEHYMSGLTVKRNGSRVVITAENADGTADTNTSDTSDSSDGGEITSENNISFTLCKPTALAHAEYPE